MHAVCRPTGDSMMLLLLFVAIITVEPVAAADEDLRTMMRGMVGMTLRIAFFDRPLHLEAWPRAKKMSFCGQDRQQINNGGCSWLLMAAHDSRGGNATVSHRENFDREPL